MKKAYRLFLILVSAVCLFSFTSCGGNSSKKFTVDGLEFSSIEVTRIQDDYFNFLVTVKNPTDSEKTIDLSKFRLKLNNSTDINHFSGVETCPAGKDSSFSIMIDNDHPEMKKGDSITVYFGEDEVKKIKVTELE